MLLPIRTDRPLKRTPWVNYGLIAANVAVHLLALSGGYRFGALYLWPGDPQLFQFVTYQFLHADLLHLGGNMLFLFIFGNNVEDRLGRVGYLLFYLAGGIFAGLAHALSTDVPVIGASGSVAAVTGAYLALFPLTNVTIIFWFILIIPLQVPSFVLILFRIGWDLMSWSMQVGNVAYLAHLAGYAHGFAVGMGLLLVRLLAREPYDLLSLLEHRRRRRQFQQLSRRQPGLWDHASPSEPGREQAAPATPEEQQRMAERAEISRALASHDAAHAGRLYRKLLQHDPEQVMSQQQQLDLANQIMAENDYETAANAYELLLKHHPGYPQRQQVELILGLIYARYLRQPERARELLQKALPRLDGSDQQLAQQVLSEIGPKP